MYNKEVKFLNVEGGGEGFEETRSV